MFRVLKININKNFYNFQYFLNYDLNVKCIKNEGEYDAVYNTYTRFIYEKGNKLKSFGHKSSLNFHF